MAATVSEALAALKTMDEPTARREIVVIEQEILEIKKRVKDAIKQRRAVIFLLRKCVKKDAGAITPKPRPPGDASPTEKKIMIVLNKHGAMDAATIAKHVGVPIGPVTIVLTRSALVTKLPDNTWKLV